MLRLPGTLFAVPLLLLATRNFLIGEWAAGLLPAALGIVILGLVYSSTNWTEREDASPAWFAVHIAVFCATLLFLLSTWYLVHRWLDLVIEGWLSPWDVVPVRPPQGTWERGLNDFFQSFPGTL
jgi:hypothetical protein